MANERNLKPYGKAKPPLSHEEAKRLGKKGAKVSAEKRAQIKTSRQIIEILDQLPVTESDQDALAALGIPCDMQTQQTLRLVALHKKALTGDPVASKLLLDIKGETPAPTINLKMGDETRAAYERAAAAIKDKGG